MDLKQYEKLKGDVDRARRDRDRAEGALAQLMQRLQQEFGCTSVADGEKLLKKLEKDLGALEAQFDEQLTQFREEWQEALDEAC